MFYVVDFSLQVLMLPLVDVCGPPTKAAPLDTKQVLVLPPVDLCAPPNTTQRQSVTSKVKCNTSFQ